MQQVRIFKTVETELATLEQDVNAWIKESGAKVLSITGNIAPQSSRSEGAIGTLTRSTFAASDVVLIVLYETAAS